MSNIIFELKKLQINKRLDPKYYKKEATKILKQYNPFDKNFKYFFLEFIIQSKDNVEIETLRETISILQRHVCMRINKEQSSDSEPIFIRDKIKHNKRRRL